MTPDHEAAIRANFDRQTLMTTFGARLAELGPGRCRIEAPILPGSRQQTGVAHAGLTFALGDSAGGYAALTLLPEGADVLTSEMKIHLLRPAAGDLLVATGEVVKAGRRLTIVKAEVHADGALVAILLGTMVPLTG